MSSLSIVENLLKYRDGKKWKERWCVLKKPSPIADSPSILLYKDESKAILKSTIPLDDFCGIEDKYVVDGEQLTLCIICRDRTVVFAFHKEEIREHWKRYLLESHGLNSCFPVNFLDKFSTADIKSSTTSLNQQQQQTNTNDDKTPCHLFLGSTRLSLSTRITSDATPTEPRHVYSCQYESLKGFDQVGEHQFYFETAHNGNLLRFTIESPQSPHINKLIRCKVQHTQQSLGLLFQIFPSSSSSSSYTDNQTVISLRSPSLPPPTPTYQSFFLQSSTMPHQKMSDKSSNNNNSNLIFLPPKGQTTPTLTTIATAIPANISKLTKIRNSSFEGSTLNRQGQDQLPLTNTSRHHSDYDLRNQEYNFNNRIADNSVSLQQQQQQLHHQQQHRNSVVSKINSDSRRSSVDCFYPTTTMSPIVSSPMQYINVNNMKTSNMTSKSALPPTPRQPVAKYRKSYSLSSSFGRLLKPFKEDQRLVPGNFKHLDKKSKNVDKTIKQWMMNGGTCEKVTKYDPLQPLPYKDLSRFDDDSDGVYMCWTASTLTDLQNKFNSPAKKVDYINLISNDDNKQSKSFPLKLKTNTSDFLKPNYSSDSINHLSTMFYAKNSLPQQQNQQNESNINKNSYVNFNNMSEKTIPQRLNNKKLVHSHSDVTSPASQHSPKTDKCSKVSKAETASNSNYITMQQLGINIFNEAHQLATSLQTESNSSIPSASKEKIKNADDVIVEDTKKDNKMNTQSILTNYSTDGNDYFEKNCEDKLMTLEQNSQHCVTDHVSFLDEEVEQGANRNVKPTPLKLPLSNDDLLREQLMKSPPPPTNCQFFPLQSSSSSLPPPTTPSTEPQDYINLSTMTSASLPPPPPLPPKTLPIIKEDVQQESSSSNPPPIPAKSKHVRNNSYERNMNQANSTITTKPEVFPVVQGEPKPPIPKRHVYTNSPGATYNQPSSNTLPFHHGKSSSVSSLSNMPLSLVRPVSASVGATKHRKPNLTVQIDGTVEEESTLMGRKLSGFSDVNSIASGNSYRLRKSSDMNDSIMSNKRSSFDASRSTTSLATSKPRNGREYLDRRRLVESPQQSPSIASTVFSFDEKSVANHCSSGEDSPRFSSGITSVGRSSSRMSQELMRRVPLTPHECLQHDSPIPDSPGNSSVRTRTSNNTLVNYADIDVLSMESSMEQPQSAKGFKIPPSTPSPHDKTVYATIDLMATVAATQVGKQHAKQRENTLEKHGDVVSRNKVNGMSNIVERGRLSLDPKRYPSSIAKE